MKSIRLTPQQFRLWRENNDDYRKKLSEETKKLWGSAILRRPNGTIIKIVRSQERIITSEVFTAAKDCPCRDWRWPNGSKKVKDEHHPECAEGKRWKDTLAGKKVEPSSMPLVKGVPTKIVELPTGQTTVDNVQTQPLVIDPQACTQCRDWTMPEGGARPSDQHHPLCSFRAGWENRPKTALSVPIEPAPQVAEAVAEAAPAPVLTSVEPENCGVCKDWTMPNGSERPKDLHHPICPNQATWLKTTKRPKLVNAETGDVLRLPTPKEIQEVIATFEETGMATLLIDGTVYLVDNLDIEKRVATDTERPPATEPTPPSFVGARTEPTPQVTKLDMSSAYGKFGEKHKPRRGKRA